MSKKFNLKDYVKIDGHEPIGSRLQKTHEPSPNVINEKQLADYRQETDNLPIEKLLQGKRIEESPVLTEGRLNTSRSKLAVHRNEKAYSGDINKLEEKRLSQDPVENEKYPSASKTSKKLRWWEMEKSSDGLKLAGDFGTSMKKVSFYDEDNPEYNEEPKTFVEEIKERESLTKKDKILGPDLSQIYNDEIVEEDDAADNEGEEDDFLIEEDNVGIVADEEFDIIPMNIIKEKFISGKYPGVYIVLEFDPARFSGSISKIKKHALNNILIEHPELANYISESDIGPVNTDNNKYTVSLRATSQELSEIVNKNLSSSVDKQNDSANVADEVADLGEENMEFTTVFNQTTDVGGTPMFVGKIKSSTKLTPENEDLIAPKAIEYIEKINPNLSLGKDSLVFDYENGEIGYAISTLEEETFDPEDVMRLSDDEKAEQYQGAEDFEEVEVDIPDNISPRNDDVSDEDFDIVDSDNKS